MIKNISIKKIKYLNANKTSNRKNEFVHFFKRLALFTMGLLIFIITPAAIISTQDNADKYSSNDPNIISLQTKSHYDSLDILFVGNSYCYSSINTSMLDSIGVKSYNLGIATAGIEFYELLIKDYLKNINIYPRKIFLLVSPMTFSSTADNYKAYPIHRYLENPISNLTISLKYNREHELFSLYRKSIEKGFFNLLSNKQGVKEMLNNPTKGFQNSDITVTEKIIKDDAPFYKSLSQEQFENAKYFNLKKLSDNLESQGIEVVLFELPTNILSAYFNREYLINYENMLAELRKQYNLIRVNSNLFSTNNYRNIDHMNSSGAALATKTIIEFIKLENGDSVLF